MAGSLSVYVALATWEAFWGADCRCYYLCCTCSCSFVAGRGHRVSVLLGSRLALLRRGESWKKVWRVFWSCWILLPHIKSYHCDDLWSGRGVKFIFVYTVFSIIFPHTSSLTNVASRNCLLHNSYSDLCLINHICFFFNFR